jgi:4-amino-4-deoxy-L-arabinose transferase-like glycosyltransferase
MGNFLKQYQKELLIIFSAALFFRILWMLVVFLKNPQGILFFDSYGYLELSENLYQTGQFGRYGGDYLFKEHFRTPGYPLFLLPFIAILKSSAMAILMQVVLSAILPVLVFLSSVLSWNNLRVAKIAAWIMILDVPSIFFASTILSDSLFSFLLVAGIFLLLYFFKKEIAYKYIFFSAFFIGLAILVRPVGLYLPILLFIVLLFSNIQFPKKTVAAVVFLVISLLPASLWMLRNQQHYDFYFFSTVGSTNLLYFRAASVYAEQQNVTETQARQELQSKLLDQHEQVKTGDYREDLKSGMKIINELAVEVIRDNPLVFLKQTIKNALLVAVKPLRSYIDVQLNLQPFYKDTSFLAWILVVFQILVLLICWIAAFLGAYQCIRQGQYFTVIFLLLLIFYFILLSAGSESDARMRLPFIPFVAMLGSLCFSKFLKTDY